MLSKVFKLCVLYIHRVLPHRPNTRSRRSTNTHIPSPWWAAVVPVMVPLPVCNKAADTLIDWFGPDDLHKVVGGERWWQVRGLDGIEAEWVTENEFLDLTALKKGTKAKSKDLSSQEETIKKMEKLETVMVCCLPSAFSRMHIDLKLPISIALRPRW